VSNKIKIPQKGDQDSAWAVKATDDDDDTWSSCLDTRRRDWAKARSPLFRIPVAGYATKIRTGFRPIAQNKKKSVALQALTNLGRLSSHRCQSFPTAPDGTGLTCGRHIESHSCIFSFPNRTVTLYEENISTDYLKQQRKVDSVENQSILDNLTLFIIVICFTWQIISLHKFRRRLQLRL
jgi:hypothetical protein